MTKQNKQLETRKKPKRIGVQEILAIGATAGALAVLVVYENAKSSAPNVGPANAPHKEYVWKGNDQSLLEVARRAYGPEKALDAEWDMEHEQGLVPGDMHVGDVVVLSEQAKIGHEVNPNDSALGSGANG
jgi:hypothetical protein